MMKFARGLLVAIALVLGWEIREAAGANILLYPFAHGMNSRLMNMEKMARILLDSGHRVSMLVSDLYRARREPPPGLRVLEFPTPPDTNLFSDAVFVRKVMRASLAEFAGLLMNQQEQFCNSLFDHRSLVTQLKQEPWDLFIMDFIDSCGRVLIDFLDVPTILYSNYGFSVEPDSFFPTPLAYAPQPLSSSSDRMTFLQRTKNVFDYGLMILLLKTVYLKPYYKIKERYGFNLTLDLEYSYSRADLIMCNTDFVFEFPRPTMPNVLTIGGMFNSPPKPVTGALRTFLDEDSKDSKGVIVVSFGSSEGAIEADNAEMFARVFSRLPYKIVWSYKGPRPTSLSDNTRVMEWLPQADLLGRNDTVLFVTHCGVSAVHETIYHGVPVVAIPLFLDQFFQAAKLIDRAQLGVKLDFWSLTEASLETAIRTVLTDSEYTLRAKKLAALARDKPVSARDTFHFWVNYLLRHGHAEHLKPKAALELTWAQYFLLDVLAFLLLCLVVILFILFVLGRFLFRFAVFSLRQPYNAVQSWWVAYNCEFHQKLKLS